MTRTRTFLMLAAVVLAGVLGLAGGAGAQTLSGGYTLSFDDNFTNSPVSGSRSAAYPTAVGAGASSTTGVGNGWIDYVGNLYSLTASGQLSNTATNNPGTNTPLNSLYRPSGENYLNGYVLGWVNTAQSNGAALTARFNPASGGSGYSAMILNGTTLYIYKAVTGTQSSLLSGYSLGTLPANYAAALIVTEPTAGTAQLTVNVYNPSDFTTVVATKTITDTTASLQSAGAWGVSGYTGARWTRVQTASTSSTLTAGTPSVVITGKTAVRLTTTAATSGTAPYTYQWKRSTVSGSEVTISGLTGQTVTDTGLTPTATYYYTCTVTDATAASAQSAEVSTTTIASTASIFSSISDSIGYGYLLASPTTQCPLAIMSGTLSHLYQYPLPGVVNDSVGGTSTSDWVPTSGYLTTMEADTNTFSATDVWERLGVNDAVTTGTGFPRSAATYQSNLQSIINHVKANCPTVQRFWLSYPTYTASSRSVAALQSYQSAVNALVAANSPFVKLGNVYGYGLTQANPPELNADGIHPLATGASDLGQEDAAAFVQGVTTIIAPVSTGGQIKRGR